jgi:hypothetical protein
MSVYYVNLKVLVLMLLGSLSLDLEGNHPARPIAAVPAVSPLSGRFCSASIFGNVVRVVALTFSNHSVSILVVCVSDRPIPPTGLHVVLVGAPVVADGTLQEADHPLQQAPCSMAAVQSRTRLLPPWDMLVTLPQHRQASSWT